MTTGATGQLGLALPVQGELSGTWGDTVNNGITQYTNIAIAATLTLTNDGAVTLANTTGDASASNITSTLTGAGTVTAQFAIVRVTGTLTTAKVVTAPSYSKTYVVVNAATGGIVTFKASGQTGVSIAVGESAWVYFNGTDYVKLAGTVAVASFQTSLSGLTPSTSTTGAVTLAGTLGTANGGTNLTSFTSGGVVYASSTSALATGSALTFDGTNLGLGGTTNTYGSQTTLTLSGSNVSRIDFRSNSTFTGTILSYQGVTEGLRLQTEVGYPITFYPANSKAMTLDTSGNLGLGVTPSAWGSGTKAFQVGSYGSVNTIGGIDVGIANNAYNDGTNWKYIASQEAAYLKVNRNTFLWNIAAAGTAGNTISFTQAMTLDASGQLAVGVTSPAYKLQSGGTAGISGELTAAYDGGNNGITFTQNWRIRRENATTGNLWIEDTNAGVARAVFDTSGNVGVGVTPNTINTGSGNIQLGNSGNRWTWVGVDPNGSAVLAMNTYYNSGYKYAGPYGAGMYLSNFGAHEWFTAAAGTANAAISFTQAMTLNTSGQLAVGTSGPLLSSTYIGKLSVFTVGGANVAVGGGSDTTNTVMSRIIGVNQNNGNSGNESSNAFQGITSIETALVTSNSNVSGDSGGYLMFKTKAQAAALTERARITSTGGFVVGTTTDPGNGIIADINGNVRTVPQSGSSKTASYTLATTDIGEYILLGASGAIVIPDATFAAGDVVTIFNNTASTATITCSITTAYIAGTFTDKATMTLAAAGVATVLFITSTLCVVSGNVT